MNIAKEIRRRRESTGRKRYLLTAEDPNLVAAVESRHPDTDKHACFVVSVFEGMRRAEQFTLTWPQNDFDLGEIHFTLTKNGDD